MGAIADKIRKAIFGGEVREVIADGIEVVEQIRKDYDNQVINAGNSNSEIVDARGGQVKLKDRLDNFDSHLEHMEQQKLNKDGIVTMANMGQDIKEALVGGGQNVAVVGENAVLEENIVDGQVTPSKISFIKTNINLFDRKKSSSKTALNTNGFTVTTTIDWCTSDFIKVTPNLKYSLSELQRICIYDINKNFISVFDKTTQTVTIPNNGAYIRFQFWSSNPLTSNIMFVSGESIPSEYVKFGYTINFKQEDIELINESKLTGIVCWGDSLTFGYGATSTTTKSYPAILQSLLGVPCVNMGISGESSGDIVVRQGGFHAIVEPFSIPNTIQAVEIQYRSSLLIDGGDSKPRLAFKGTTGINPVIIDGVKGTITYSDSKYYFTPLNANNGKTIKRPTQVITNCSVLYKDYPQVIFIGTNGGWIKTNSGEDYAINTLIAQIKSMIKFNTSNKYIVIGMHYFYDWVIANGITKDRLEKRLTLEFGENYINLRKYLIEYGLDDAMITPTTEDLEDITNGLVPRSLLISDKIHGNDKFYEILANQVFIKGKELGYWL